MDGRAFGLKNAPNIIMRFMDDVLRPFTKSFVVVYLDDILIFNRNWEENMQHIQQFFALCYSTSYMPT
jgi:hypothetical protein